MLRRLFFFVLAMAVAGAVMAVGLAMKNFALLAVVVAVVITGGAWYLLGGFDKPGED